MTQPASNLLNRGWHDVARAAYQWARPTVALDLLGSTFKVRSEARMQRGVGDRDYAVIRDLARDRHCILDVGANIGLTALLMAGSMATDGHIFAFEASEEGCRLIRDHAALNGLDARVTVINALVAERSGLTIDFFGESASGGASIIPGYLDHHRPLRKATLALDDFVAGCGCAPDLIKIDVEGAELRVVAGLTQTMQVHRPLLFVELHSWSEVSVPQTAARLLSQLEPLNYALIYMRTKAVVIDPAELAGRGRCHVLLCPHESPFAGQLPALDTGGL